MTISTVGGLLEYMLVDRVEFLWYSVIKSITIYIYAQIFWTAEIKVAHFLMYVCPCFEVQYFFKFFFTFGVTSSVLRCTK